MPVSLLLLVACAAQELGPVVNLPETGERYRISDRAVTIDEALELARLAGGRLLELASEDEESAVRKAFGAARYWLGLEYPRETWTSGAPVTWTHWDEGEPSHGDGESFTITGWNEATGAWNDVSGASDRFLALIELHESASEVPVALSRAVHPKRNVFLAVVEGLTAADFEDGFLASWHDQGRLLGVRAEADPLACWGLATEGVGSAKSDLVSGSEPPKYIWYPNVLDRLEGLRPELHTAWLFDDPELSRLLASGARTDVRVSEHAEAYSRAYEELVNHAAPMVIVLGRTLPTKKAERTSRLRGLARELQLFLGARQVDPRRKGEEWLFAVVGLPSRSANVREAGKRSEDDEGSSTVPLFLCGPSLQSSAMAMNASLADLVPTILAYLGLRPGIGWGLDGLALERPLPALGVELLVNGGAEVPRVRREMDGPVPGWTVSSGIRTSVYRQRNFERTAPGPVARGTNLFSARGNEPWMEQVVDLSSLAARIDAKELVAELNGWLGARWATDKKVALVAEALGANGKVLERAESEVGLSELRDELGVVKGELRAGLVERRVVLELPMKTRLVRVRLDFRGRGADYCGADELSLVLRER